MKLKRLKNALYAQNYYIRNWWISDVKKGAKRIVFASAEILLGLLTLFYHLVISTLRGYVLVFILSPFMKYYNKRFDEVWEEEL